MPNIRFSSLTFFFIKAIHLARLSPPMVVGGLAETPTMYITDKIRLQKEGWPYQDSAKGESYYVQKP